MTCGLLSPSPPPTPTPSPSPSQSPHSSALAAAEIYCFRPEEMHYKHNIVASILYINAANTILLQVYDIYIYIVASMLYINAAFGLRKLERDMGHE